MAKDYTGDMLGFLKKQYLLEDKKPIGLEEWQIEKILRPLFYTLDRDGHRFYREALIGIPKKNGKSTLLAGIAMHQMLFPDEPAPEVYSVAGKKDQAAIIFRKAVLALKRNPKYAKGIERGQIKVYERDKRIWIPQKESEYRVISADAPLEAGFNPTCVLFDEFFNQPSRHLYDLIITSRAARRQPLLIMITTAGYDLTSVCYKLYKQALGETAETECLGRAATHDPRMWFLWLEHNPASWITEEFLEAQKKKLPPFVYQTWHENKWVGGEGGVFTEEQWERCVDRGWRQQLAGQEDRVYYLATDLGLRHDRTAAAVCHFDREQAITVLDRLQLWEGSRKDEVWIRGIPDWMRNAARDFGIRYGRGKIVVDPYQMKQSIQEMKAEGFPIEAWGFTGGRMQQVSANLYTLVSNGLLRVFPDQGLKDEVLALRGRQTSRGWRIDHEKSGHDDQAVAVGMAALAAIEGSRFVDPDVIWLDGSQAKEKDERSSLQRIAEAEGERLWRILSQ